MDPKDTSMQEINSSALTADMEVRQMVFNAKLPCKILVEGFWGQPSQTLWPLYILIPKVAYLPSIIARIQRYFSYQGVKWSRVDEIAADPNFDLSFWIKNVEIPWYYPFGLIIDRIFGAHNWGNVQYPITIVVKPSTDSNIGALSMAENMASIYVSALKQSDHLLYSTFSNSKIGKLGHVELDRLWEGVWEARFEAFWKVNSTILDFNADNLDSERSKQNWNHIPIRIYPIMTGEASEDSREYLNISLDFSKTKLGFNYIQELVPANSGFTLADTLELCLNRHYSKFSWPTTHGIELPLDVSVDWLLLNMSYADNFVHIVILVEQ